MKKTGIIFLFTVIIINNILWAQPSVIQGPLTYPANDHTYYLLDASSWTDAEAAAVSLGGHLVTINDQDENNWVWKMFYPGHPNDPNDPDPHLWIGLNDIDSEGTFEWTNGDPVTFTNWDNNQPSNSGGIEDYVGMWEVPPPDASGIAGKWNDFDNLPPVSSRIGYGVVEIIEPEMGSWIFMPSMNTERQAHNAVLGQDGYIYAVGGRDSSNIVLPSVERYDRSTRQWTAVASMNSPRWLHEVIECNGFIYAIGGRTQASILSTMDVYDPQLDSWNISPYTLNIPRIHFAVTKDHSDKIYAIGGIDINGVIIDSVEVFDPANPALGWQILGHNLNETRGYLGSGTDTLGRIYAIAGATSTISNSETVTVERFDPENPSAGWTYGPSLNQDRQVGAYATDCKGTIYVLGGWAGGSGPHLTTVEVYDHATDSWVLHSNMNRAINHFAAAFDMQGNLYAIGGEHFNTQEEVEAIKAYKPLSINAPNGLESLLVGENLSILWEGIECIDTVAIDYSDDCGVTWQAIDPNTENDGNYVWVPSQINSDQCIIRVCDISQPAVCDASNQLFTIFECQETLTADIDGNCFVDITDFSLFVLQWLLGGNPFDPGWIP